MGLWKAIHRPENVLEDSFHKGFPIANCPHHVLAEYEVVLLAFDPGAFHVINLEPDIGRNPV